MYSPLSILFSRYTHFVAILVSLLIYVLILLYSDKETLFDKIWQGGIAVLLVIIVFDFGGLLHDSSVRYTPFYKIDIEQANPPFGTESETPSVPGAKPQPEIVRKIRPMSLIKEEK